MGDEPPLSPRPQPLPNPPQHRALRRRREGARRHAARLLLAKEAAEKAGAALYLRVPALGTRPDFVAAMADVVREGERGQAKAGARTAAPAQSER